MKRAALFLTVLAGCNGGGEGDGDQAPGPDADITGLVYAACDPTERVGLFEVILEDAPFQGEPYTAVGGYVDDGLDPSLVYRTVMQQGDCRLVKATTFTCTPDCGAGMVCDQGNTCIAAPTGHQDVGTVEVAGMAVAVSMALRPTKLYDFTGEMPHPGYAPGAGISLSATGGIYTPFTLRGWGVSPITPSVTELMVDTGAPLELSWSAPPAEGPARVQLQLGINRHGSSGGLVECDVPDTGSFTIPEALVTALFAEGVSGFPALIMTRSSSDKVELAPGCVELRVRASHKRIELLIPGLDSCREDIDCPMGETCQGDLTCM